MRISSFEPFVDRNTRLMILGSMPSEKSLHAHQYYGNSIALNGGKAAKGYQKYFAHLPVKTILLPSSSPIPTQQCKTLEDKLIIWQQRLSMVLQLDELKDNLR